EVPICDQIFGGSHGIALNVAFFEWPADFWRKRIRMKNRIARVLSSSRKRKILAGEYDRIRTHSASQVQSRRRDGSPNFEGALSKSVLREQRIWKQAQAEQKPARSRGKSDGLYGLFRNHVHRFRDGAGHMPGVQFA